LTGPVTHDRCNVDSALQTHTSIELIFGRPSPRTGARSFFGMCRTCNYIGTPSPCVSGGAWETVAFVSKGTPAGPAESYLKNRYLISAAAPRISTTTTSSKMADSPQFQTI
jgi:hypothetical protein